MPSTATPSSRCVWRPSRKPIARLDAALNRVSTPLVTCVCGTTPAAPARGAVGRVGDRTALPALPAGARLLATATAAPSSPRRARSQFEHPAATASCGDATRVHRARLPVRRTRRSRETCAALAADRAGAGLFQRPLDGRLSGAVVVPPPARRDGGDPVRVRRWLATPRDDADADLGPGATRGRLPARTIDAGRPTCRDRRPLGGTGGAACVTAAAIVSGSAQHPWHVGDRPTRNRTRPRPRSREAIGREALSDFHGRYLRSLAIPY